MKLKLTLFCLIFFFVSIISFIVYILGALHLLSGVEENTCDMTYMFEYPQYVRIKLSDQIEKRYPKYGLYAYGEGFITGKLRKMQFTGIPVLFVPGNAGSHEQVRSLASVSLRMGLKRRTSYHFDYFTVSLAEGYSALYGGILEDQTAFVAGCIQKILSLYKGKVEKIVVIGHSMGGIVAQAALLYNSANRSLASIAITLATPYTPRIVFDKTLSDYYNDVRSKIATLREMETAVISIGGGSRDILVTSNQIINPHADLNVVSTAIPDVWKSLDHLSILWCKQFVLALVRTLFDSVDVSQKGAKIYHNFDIKLQAFKYHLMGRYAGKYFYRGENWIMFDSNGEWIEILQPQFVFQDSTDDSKEKKRDLRSTYLMIPINGKFTHLSINTINLDTKDWLFICSASSHGFSKVCEWGWSLTNRTTLLPALKNKLKNTVDLALEQFRQNKEFTHIIVKIPKKSDDFPVVYIDLYNKDTRTRKINEIRVPWLPQIFYILFTSNNNLFLTSNNSHLRHFVELEGIPDVVSVQLQKISPQSSDSNKRMGHAVIELVESGGTGNTTFANQVRTLSNENIGQAIPLRMQISNSAVIKVTLEPGYFYEIMIRRGGIIDRMAIYVRDRYDRLYHVLVSFCLLVISTRVDEEGRRTKTTLLVTLFGILLLRLDVEGIVALGFLNVFAVSTCFIVIFSGSLLHSFTARFLTKAIALFPATWYDWLLREGTYEHLPILSSLLVLSLISTSCGALVMLISVVIYLLKLTHMYEDYLEELLISSFRAFTTKFDKLFKSRKKMRNREEDGKEDVDPRTNIVNHLILFITWSLAAGSAIPSVLVWAKNFSHETRLLSEDPVMLSSWVVITGWGSLGLVKIPAKSTNQYINSIGVNFQRLLGWFLLLTAGSQDPTAYQWIIAPTVALSITCIVLLSLLSRFKKRDSEESHTSEDNKNNQLVEEIARSDG